MHCYVTEVYDLCLRFSGTYLCSQEYPRKGIIPKLKFFSLSRSFPDL